MYFARNWYHYPLGPQTSRGYAGARPTEKLRPSDGVGDDRERRKAATETEAEARARWALAPLRSSGPVSSRLDSTRALSRSPARSLALSSRVCRRWPISGAGEYLLVLAHSCLPLARTQEGKNHAECARHGDSAVDSRRWQIAGDLRRVVHRHISAPAALQGLLLPRAAPRGACVFFATLIAASGVLGFMPVILGGDMSCMLVSGIARLLLCCQFVVFFFSVAGARSWSSCPMRSWFLHPVPLFALEP